jgi:hypothetical protein
VRLTTGIESEPNRQDILSFISPTRHPQNHLRFRKTLQVYARALAAAGFKGLRAAAQLAGDGALLKILSGGAFERLATDTVCDPASTDFTPRGGPADLLQDPPEEGTAAERVSVYLQVRRAAFRNRSNE